MIKSIARLFLIFLFIFTYGLPQLSAQAEYYTNPEFEEKKEPKERKLNENLFFGGNFWLSFGYTTYIELSPIVGYKLTPRLKGAVGFTYMFQTLKVTEWQDTISITKNISTSRWGPKAWLSFDLIKNLDETINIGIGDIFVHTEYELLNVEGINMVAGKLETTDHFWINSLLVGGGIYQSFGGRGGASFLILWNLLDSPYSPYANPIFRMGFYF